MSAIHRSTTTGLLCAMLAMLALLPAGTRAQDTSAVRRTSQGILVDFQDTDLRAVITALAEAGGINVSYADFPARRFTLHIRQPVPREAVPALLKSIAQTNGLSYRDEGGLVQLAPLVGAQASVNAGAQQDTTQRDFQIFIYHLKHARAAQMAATLQAIFGLARGGPPTAQGIRGTSLSQQLRDQSITPTTLDSTRRVSTTTASDPTILRAQLRGDIQVVPDERTNALVVRAIPVDWETIRKAIEAIDLRPLQALIEVVIAEVRINTDLELGASGSVTATNGATPPNTRGATATSTAPSDFLFQLTQNNPHFTANVALAALATRGSVRILSRPLIVAQNNEEAKILVGEQRPFVQVARSLPTDNAVVDQVIQYRDVATTLTILPTINPDGYVNLQILQEVSSATTEVQFGAPVISTREASTHLFVRDGQTAVFGGLVAKENDRTRSGLPLLSGIPFIGGLFGTQSTTTSANELYLFLTPHVIATDDDVDRIRDGLKREGGDSTGLHAAERPIIPSAPDAASKVDSTAPKPKKP
jgi:type II secretory pathway component GspD/PulD (secretin)